jgi:peptidoglycan hydrolase-like protein with peptidoglycan-binding domain
MTPRIRSRAPDSLHSTEAPVRNAAMRLLRYILIFLAIISVSNASADDVVFGAQTKLKQLGYYNGVVDGQMGSQTAAAIRRFQVAQKLKVTGEMNPQTLRRLGITTPKNPAPIKATPGAPGYVNLATIFRGGPLISSGPETQILIIKQAQKNLKLLGYYNGPINGLPSPTLVASLKAWQRSAGFRQTGRFDETTLKGLSLIPNY